MERTLKANLEHFRKESVAEAREILGHDKED